MNRQKIGGEYEINPVDLNGIENNIPTSQYLFSSGRVALLAILKGLKERNGANTIHIPYYICESVINTCFNARYNVNFYELNNDFQFPLEYLETIKKNEILLTVNYFGLVDDYIKINEIKVLRPETIIISDQVQSYWTFNRTNADYSFTSLRKHFPVPDGALVYSNGANLISSENLDNNIFYKNKLLGSILKNQNINDESYLHFLNLGEEELDCSHEISSASNVCSFLFNKLDLNTFCKKRKENYKFVFEFCKMNGIQLVFPFNENDIPLNVPILIDNRDIVRRELFKSNIYLPIHWPINEFNKNSLKSNKMANNELSLVVDQRYTIDEIEYELKTLKNIITNGK